jgi:hypothetical protein
MRCDAANGLVSIYSNYRTKYAAENLSAGAEHTAGRGQHRRKI